MEGAKRPLKEAGIPPWYLGAPPTMPTGSRARQNRASPSLGRSGKEVHSKKAYLAPPRVALMAVTVREFGQTQTPAHENDSKPGRISVRAPFRVSRARGIWTAPARFPRRPSCSVGCVPTLILSPKTPVLPVKTPAHLACSLPFTSVHAMLADEPWGCPA